MWKKRMAILGVPVYLFILTILIRNTLQGIVLNSILEICIPVYGTLLWLPVEFWCSAVSHAIMQGCISLPSPMKRAQTKTGAKRYHVALPFFLFWLQRWGKLFIVVIYGKDRNWDCGGRMIRGEGIIWKMQGQVIGVILVVQVLSYSEKTDWQRAAIAGYAGAG